MTSAVSASSRQPLADALKAIAAQFIVLHHLAHYGPMADAARDLAPWLFDWLDEYGRMAVQVFLVVGGYLAARSLMTGMARGHWELLPQLGRRYLRLVVPYTAALLLAIGLSAVARQLMVHDSISAPASATQVTAHLLLLQGLLDYEALTAGAWYLAIDFQLYALLALLLWLPRQAGLERLGLVAVVFLLTASLFYFNLDADWDNWALYFFGSYGIGVVAYWATAQRRHFSGAALVMLLCGLALILEFRWRIALAMVVALLLLVPLQGKWFDRIVNARPVVFLAEISFATFLVHFPVSLVINGLFIRFCVASPAAHAMGVLLAWMASLLAGALFYRVIGQGLMPALGIDRSVRRKPTVAKATA